MGTGRELQKKRSWGERRIGRLQSAGGHKGRMMQGHKGQGQKKRRRKELSGGQGRGGGDLNIRGGKNFGNRIQGPTIEGGIRREPVPKGVKKSGAEKDSTKRKKRN